MIYIKKYLTVGIIFLLLAVNVNSLSPLHTNACNQTKGTVSLEELEMVVTDGRGLTVQIFNNGSTDVNDLQLKVDVDGGKLVIIPKKIYTVPTLAVGDSTEVYVSLFGVDLGIFFDPPIINVTLNIPGFQTLWTKVSIKVFGLRTKILTRISNDNESYKGYTLFSPEYSTDTYLIDMDGKIVHTWHSQYIQGFGTYLLGNGDLLRLDEFGADVPFSGAGRAGRVEKFDNQSNLLWEFVYANDKHCSHHDIEPLPNGNILMIAWELKTRDEAVSAGRNPDLLHFVMWPDHVIEVKPNGSRSGDIVWEWHVWDHLIQDYDATKENYGIIKDHPELINVNFNAAGTDWTHINAVDYNEKFDQILLCVRNFNEIWVIDHSTTTEEAAGHTGGNSGKGGDLLYRWGNPQAYNTGVVTDQQYFGQHGANWIEDGCPGAGNIIVFNNGGLGRNYSSVDEIVPPVDENGRYAYEASHTYGPAEPIWIYTAENPSDMFSLILSNAQRLPNGNTLICNGLKGLLIEVTYEKEIVWNYQYQNMQKPGWNDIAHVMRYSLDYLGIP